MDTIFYYTDNGKIISIEELSSLFNGFTSPHGNIGIVKNDFSIIVENGYIQNIEEVRLHSSLLPQEKVLDVFTEIVNRNANSISKDELDSIVNSYNENIVMKDHNKVMREKRKEYEEKKRIKREKTKKAIKMAVIVAGVTAITVAGAKYITNCDKIADDTYDILKANHCYIRNTENGTMVAINDHNELYGKPNPAYRDMTYDDYYYLEGVLVENGYDPTDTSIAISTIVQSKTAKSFDDYSLGDKIQYVLSYEGNERAR